MIVVNTYIVYVDLNHSNHVSSMDEEKAMQNLLEYPIEFVKYPFNCVCSLCVVHHGR